MGENTLRAVEKRGQYNARGRQDDEFATEYSYWQCAGHEWLALREMRNSVSIYDVWRRSQHVITLWRVDTPRVWACFQFLLADCHFIRAAENNNYPKIAPDFCSDSRRGKWRILEYAPLAETQKLSEKASKVG